MAEITDLTPLAGIDWGEPIQSQYSASPRIIALSKKNAALLDNLPAVQDFFKYYLNPETAQGTGLDDWARIVGLPSRKVLVQSFNFFGFAGSGLQPFDQAPFYNPGTGVGMVNLTDNALRWLILYKAMANIGSETLADMNAMLSLFAEFTNGNGAAYVIEIGIMQVRAVFEYGLSLSERGLLKSYGLINKGAGVGVEYLEVNPPVFGFSNDDMQTSIFGEAPFFNGGVTSI